MFSIVKSTNSKNRTLTASTFFRPICAHFISLVNTLPNGSRHRAFAREYCRSLSISTPSKSNITWVICRSDELAAAGSDDFCASVSAITTTLFVVCVCVNTNKSLQNVMKQALQTCNLIVLIGKNRESDNFSNSENVKKDNL